jgi:hypothetical protein
MNYAVPVLLVLSVRTRRYCKKLACTFRRDALPSLRLNPIHFYCKDKIYINAYSNNLRRDEEFKNPFSKA